jgi:hypothetical protein
VARPGRSLVPIDHGRWLADSIPGAEAELRDHDGDLEVKALVIFLPMALVEAFGSASITQGI